MKTAKYALAKYIPDLNRIEPRNIGVIVWTPDGIEARFAAEKTDRPGEIDGRSVPAFVTSSNAYRQWIQFWRTELQKPEIEVATTGDHISQGSSEYLAALQSWNKGNFVVADAGMVLDRVDPEELPSIADDLFRNLVDTSSADETRDPSLDEVMDQLLEETELDADPNFKTCFTVLCQITSTIHEEFEFSHAYQNGALQRLYQRVPLSRKRTQLRKTVHDTAWMFEKVIEAEIVTQQQTAAIIYASDDELREQPIRKAVDLLSAVGRVLNLKDYDDVREEFAGLATAYVQH